MRIQTFSDINFKGHHLLGLIWSVESSRSGEFYKVEMNNLGLSCNCVAGSMRGKCKHAQYVHDLLIDDNIIKYEVA